MIFLPILSTQWTSTLHGRLGFHYSSTKRCSDQRTSASSPPGSGGIPASTSTHCRFGELINTNGEIENSLLSSHKFDARSLAQWNVYSCSNLLRKRCKRRLSRCTKVMVSKIAPREATTASGYLGSRAHPLGLQRCCEVR